jgi:hypothetical protein
MYPKSIEHKCQNQKEHLFSFYDALEYTGLSQNQFLLLVSNYQISVACYNSSIRLMEEAPHEMFFSKIDLDNLIKSKT